MRAGRTMSAVSAYFTIYAQHALRAEFDQIGQLRFLFGEPRFAAGLDPGEQPALAFTIAGGEESNLHPTETLRQKGIAKSCAEWVKRESVQIRSMKASNLLHGKMYHFAGNRGEQAALVGSSNLTMRGMGFSGQPNIEINMEIGEAAACRKLAEWFDDLWGDNRRVVDAKQKVLEALEELHRDFSPEFVYYKTLYHLFWDQLQERKERDAATTARLGDSQIWQALYEYQRHGANGAIAKIHQHNGCLLADSVGLGKTYTALAVIRYFELRNERVLVLCPRKLRENWNLYREAAGNQHNPFPKDRFGYMLLSHTDLGRSSGRAGDVDLANFNWSAFDLVVIDESHNFRNTPKNRIAEDGEIIRYSRYNWLIEKIIGQGAHTKVLMLSATPVNTSLRDLRNQIYLMTAGDDAAFGESLGIGSLRTMLGAAQREFKQWEEQRQSAGGRQPGKRELLESLGPDLLSLLDGVSIARSRKHIAEHYPGLMREIGGFPKREKPENLHPPTDLQGRISYGGLNEQIGQLALSLYHPSMYLKDKQKLEEEKRLGRDVITQDVRESYLIEMMRVNLLKRLESSAEAFRLTMGNIIQKAESLDGKISEYLRGAGGELIEFDTIPEMDEEDEDFVVGKQKTYHLRELNVEAWRRDLAADLQQMKAIRADIEVVKPEDDAKLQELRKILEHKLQQQNRKALIFTAFGDTVKYLHSQLCDWARERGAHIALVTGSGGNKSSLGGTDFQEILASFAPRAWKRGAKGAQIDILLATDCISEGQNLQDCDLVINYDIHWNPVRLMQRFGRVDRLGSENQIVRMVNFWPTENLNLYLDLENRVKSRMALMDATATGEDDMLSPAETGERAQDEAQRELSFRNRQIRNLREEITDLEQQEDGLALSEFTLDDFLAELLSYLESNRKQLEAAPFGIFALADCAQASRKAGLFASGELGPGAIFCLQLQRPGGARPSARRSPNPTHPYFLACVRNSGEVRYHYAHAKQILSLFGDLCRGENQPHAALCRAFDKDTQFGANMERYATLLQSALSGSIVNYKRAANRRLTTDRSAVLEKPGERPERAGQFRLITWLIIEDGGNA